MEQSTYVGLPRGKMGNKADKKRLRELAGEKIYKGDVVISEKDEMLYIPFIQSGNTDEERPWLYKGYYRMPDGAIDMELKRMDGHMELSVKSIENYKEYIHEAVGGFISKVYKESPHEAKSISIEQHDEETHLLQKTILSLEAELNKAKEINEKMKQVISEL